MGFSNPGVSWTELEARLSGRFDGSRADGGDAPAWSQKRASFEVPSFSRHRSGTPYAELHCHSNFSFLDGASHPEELVTEAARLDLEALAITDHNGFYGVVRFAEAAREVGMATVFGCELSLGMTAPQNGVADPEGEHQIILARDPQGYAALGSLISRAQMAGEKGAPLCSMDDVAEAAAAGAADHWVLLTGGRKGRVPRTLVERGPSAAGVELQRLVDMVGRHNVCVELWDHGDPLDGARNDDLARLAARCGTGLVATNNVHYATPARRRLATALAAVRARRSLEDLDGWFPPSAAAHMRSGDEQARRFVRYPGVVEAAAELGRECAFDLKLVAPNLPPFPCPSGHSEMSWLREIVRQGAVKRYGPRDDEWVPGAWGQVERELDVIEELGFPGYFLVVWDIVEFCRVNDILCQGRGSAANSAVCYVLGVTKADSVSLGLLFERFLSPERDGPPDIDIDIESGRREEVIQYVYKRHGRAHAAQVANVITYRAKSSIRDMAKALGYATGQQDAFAKQLDRWGALSEIVEGKAEQNTAGDSQIPIDVLELAAQVEHFPRHLGIHSGGMVMCDRPVVEVCPVEWGRMADRSVLQWDKEDCAAAGLVKFDLLGLGMLTALHLSVDLIAQHHDVDIDIATLPQDSEVYDMLCAADSVGVFQVESRAQMATLPRLRPRNFYDLVVEVALIRPGPIQGGSVHPYIRRRNGKEPVTYLHPLLENSLQKTLGIPLFQEQLMQMAIDVAGFTPAESDELRQAMGSKRSQERMARLEQRLYKGMAERGITGAIADEIFDKMAAFSNYGFPESHSVSFAYLVYASSWIKLRYPAAFCTGLLNAQPMGFYSPQSLVLDARRHGVVVNTPDLNASADQAILEPCEESFGGVAVRLGLSSVRGIGDDLAAQIAENGPYGSMEDLVRRADVNINHVEALATAGAFGCLGLERRAALWQAGAVIQSRSDRLPGIITGTHAPQLPGMSEQEEAIADLWATGISPDGHPTTFLREDLDRMGATTAVGLRSINSGTRVWVGGVVTHRQRPATAGGTLFINLEDETGLINVVCSKGCWIRHRRVARSQPALLIRGRLEATEGVYNVIAERIEPLAVAASVPSRDFR
ncbi:MAG: error-prone DNA polymerase [Actinomycetia bacterium]|nr:error-prone DNA polymerase [Actinomycetes bacterium]